MDVNELLAEKHDEHGDFGDNCAVMYRLQKALFGHLKDETEVMTTEMFGALQLITLKLARIVTHKSPAWAVDSLTDLVGYAELLRLAAAKSRGEGRLGYVSNEDAPVYDVDDPEDDWTV